MPGSGRPGLRNVGPQPAKPGAAESSPKSAARRPVAARPGRDGSEGTRRQRVPSAFARTSCERCLPRAVDVDEVRRVATLVVLNRDRTLTDPPAGAYVRPSAWT